MTKKMKNHSWYYAVLVTILVVGLILISLSGYNNQIQSVYIIMTAVLSFTWSLAHHYVHHQLHPNIVIEYALIMSLGVILSFFLFTA